MIDLSESYLDASVSSDNDNLNINGYKLVRADHPENVKRGVVCVYFRESLPVRCFPSSYSKKCLILEVSINNKTGYAVSLYRSPSQTSDEFNSFITNLEKIVVDIFRSNPHFLLLIGDFNAKSTDWSSNDTTTAEGAQLNYFTSLYGMKQVITEPTHILESPASCTDLIFTNQPNANHLLLIVVATEALVQRCSVKKVFLEISQNSQENTCTRVSFLLKLQPLPPPPPPPLINFGIFKSHSKKN